jgi:hypothetical protein
MPKGQTSKDRNWKIAKHPVNSIPPAHSSIRLITAYEIAQDDCLSLFEQPAML